MSVLELGQSGEGGDRGYPLMESEVPRFLQPTSLPAEACVAHLCENQIDLLLSRHTRNTRMLNAAPIMVLLATQLDHWSVTSTSPLH